MHSSWLLLHHDAEHASRRQETGQGHKFSLGLTIVPQKAKPSSLLVVVVLQILTIVSGREFCETSFLTTPSLTGSRAHGVTKRKKQPLRGMKAEGSAQVSSCSHPEGVICSGHKTTLGVD